MKKLSTHKTTILLNMLLLTFFLGVPNYIRCQSVEKILRDYVEDFRNDPASKNEKITFGIHVKDQDEWHVAVDGQGGVELIKGKAHTPAVFYKTDFKTLKKIYSGELAAITAMGKAKSSDYAPMDIGVMKGFTPDPAFFDRFIPFTFHFWTRGFPEMVKFGDKKYTREVHGGNATVFYYQKGLRSAWFQIEKGQHVNKKKEDQVNPFPTLLMFTKGVVEARIGGKYMKIESNNTVFIPANVSHEFWNNSNVPAEVIVIMFGEGA